MHKRKPLTDRLYRRKLRNGTYSNVWSVFGIDHRGQRYFASTKRTERGAALDEARRIDDARTRQIDPSAAAAAKLTLDDAYALARAQTGKKLATHRARDGFIGHVRRALRIADGRTEAAVASAAFAEADEGRQLVGAIMPIDVERYSNARLAEGAAPYVIQKEIWMLTKSIKLAAANRRYFGVDPKTLTPDFYRKRDNYYTPGSGWLRDVTWCDALIAAAEELYGWGDDIACYLQMGVRNGERALFNREDVHMQGADGPYVEVWGTKTRKAKRAVALSSTMVELLTRRLATTARFGAPVFAPDPNTDAKVKGAWRLARKRIVAATPAAWRDELEFKLPVSLCCNDLRRTFCSHMARAGVPLHHCAELLGHKSLDMVMAVYKQVDETTHHAAVAKLPRLQLAAPLADAAE